MARLSMHGRGLRGLLATPVTGRKTGRFGRMFPGLPPCAAEEDWLLRLGDVMTRSEKAKQLGEVDNDENPTIPAGYTYFGQFIDHDITLDTASTLDREQDPEGLVDFRTPRLDLDSLYGRGPADQPYLYQADGLRLNIGHALDTGSGQHDLPRAEFFPEATPPSGGRALIGDARNDENMIVAQLHATFIAFHNQRCDDLAPDMTQLSPAAQFARVTTDVRWHYQYVVVNDFLARLCGDVVQKLIGAVFEGGAPSLQFYVVDADDYPFMPVEFSVAAYRLGHSMIRPAYHLNDLNRGFETDKNDQPTNRVPIFSSNTDPNVQNDLRGFEPIAGRGLRDLWGIEWKYFLEFQANLMNHTTSPVGVSGPAFSYRIDTELVLPLMDLPGDAPPELAKLHGANPLARRNELAQRNLLRGRALKLPSGQSVAAAMGMTPLERDQLRPNASVPGAAGLDEKLWEETPLWYYILKEAEVLSNGERLGPVGARLVAETFIGLLWHDPSSYLRAHPWWHPDIGPANGTGFKLQHLVAHALGIPDPRP